MKKTALFLATGLLLSGPGAHFSYSSIATDPIVQSAEFYFLNREYKSALELWQRVLKATPDHPRAGLRVLELTLLVEGREALKEAAVVVDQTREVSPELRRAVRDRLHSLQATFLTDQGQTSFYQALPRMERLDCASALPLLESANQAEKGNTRVLKEKALCERRTEAFGSMLDSLRAGYNLDPFNRWFAEELVESEIFQGEYSALVTRLKKEPLSSLSERERLAFAVALYERDETERARQLLAQLREGWGSHPPPIALYLWSSLDKTEGPRFLARFRSAVRKLKPAKETVWDPYRLQARLEALKK